jgi:hypothetical protein
MLWEDRSKNYEELVNLARDFRYTAQMFGQIIIAERNLPPWKKTIKPLNVGGIAGGLKFIVRGILFKNEQIYIDVINHIDIYYSRSIR